MLRALLPVVATLFIRFLRSTWRIQLSGHLPGADDGPVVFCFWHGNQAGLLAYPHHRKIAVIASLSADGELQTRILSSLGFFVSRGSSSRSGAQGLKGLVDAMKNGCDGAFAVDGPRGPIHLSKPGAIEAARCAGARLFPIFACTARHWLFHRTWDQYTLPKPFARIAITVGAPLSPHGLSTEALDASINALSQKRDLAAKGLE